jgi:hypothetical protein
MTRVALFVERAVVAQPRRASPLERLWTALAGRVCTAPDIEVIGISKGHIEHLKHDPVAPGAPTKLPTNVIALDQMIRDRHVTNALDNVAIAFDCKPAITAPDLAGEGRCAEVEWLLRRLVARGVLPERFLEAAQRLQAWYAGNPVAPRASGRPPRFALEVLFMAPCFDALFAGDEATVRTGTGHQRYPKDWPTFDLNDKAPERSFLDQATRLATRDARKGIPGHYVSARHEWGERFVSVASKNARLLAHPIATRLGTLLV